MHSDNFLVNPLSLCQFMILCVVVAVVASVGYGQLPPGCTNLHDQVLSTTDPMSIFPENRELEDVAPPRRIGSFRQSKAYPTHSFATNQAKAGGEPPIKTEPYTGKFQSNSLFLASTLKWKCTGNWMALVPLRQCVRHCYNMLYAKVSTNKPVIKKPTLNINIFWELSTSFKLLICH